MDQRLVRMGAEGFAEFIELLEQPAEAIRALVDVPRRPALWDSTSSGRSEHSTALYPHRAAAGPLSCLLPGQLVTDLAWAGQGVGSGLLRYALGRCLEASRLVGGRPV